MSFKVGDRVVWESQSGGYSAEKTGEVVAVVPAMWPKSILCCLPDYKFHFIHPCYNTGPIDDAGTCRNHESYLVAVQTGKTAKAKKTLYWPRVKGLRLVEQKCE